MTDALLRQWTLLRLIPRAPRKADVSQLLALLADAGHAITRRQLQRDLNTLSRLFPISADERGVAHGWSWLREAPAFDLPRMDGATALSVKLLEQFIPQLLPPTLKDHLQPYFRQADTVLAEHARTEPRPLARPRSRRAARNAAARARGRYHRRSHRLPGRCSTANASPPTTPRALPLAPSRANTW